MDERVLNQDAHVPLTLTIPDIKKYYGIGSYKWEAGVAKGLFPAPIMGFDRPQRWNKRDIDEALSRVKSE